MASTSVSTVPRPGRPLPPPPSKAKPPLPPNRFSSVPDSIGASSSVELANAEQPPGLAVTPSNSDTAKRTSGPLRPSSSVGASLQTATQTQQRRQLPKIPTPGSTSPSPKSPHGQASSLSNSTGAGPPPAVPCRNSAVLSLSTGAPVTPTRPVSVISEVPSVQSTPSLQPAPTSPTALPTSLGIAPDPPAVPAVPMAHRDHVAKEILSTERVYVVALNELVERLLKPLSTENILQPEEVKLVFGNIADIHALNDTLLGDLEVRIEQNWSPQQRIGDVVSKMTPFLKMYKDYTQQYDSALKKLKELTERNGAFVDFVQKWEQSPKQTMVPLPAYLIMPIQRIPRYNLLLMDLLKNTDSSHPDYSDLSHSLKKMQEVAQFINESIKQAEARTKMIEIQNSFISSYNFIEPHRIYVKDGPLMKVCRKATKQRWFFLFNDSLVYADIAPSLPSGATYIFRQLFQFNKLKIKSLHDDKYVNAFQLISPSKSFVVIAKSPEEKTQWIEAIESGKTTFCAKQNSFSQGVNREAMADNFEAPVWIPDKDAPRCLLCAVEFTFINRRHHCRICGRVVCGTCSNKKMALEVGSKEQHRVCKFCFEQRAKEKEVSGGDSPKI